MPNNNFEHIIHKHSSVVTNGNPKLPTTNNVEYGEIAVNYAKDYETISLKNSNNEIITFSSDNAIKKLINEDAYVISNSLNDLNSRIGAVEDRKMDKINGTSSQFVKGDGSLDSNAYAPKASPALTGTPTAPTASSGTNTTQIATTAFVQSAVPKDYQVDYSKQYLTFEALESGTFTFTTNALQYSLDNGATWTSLVANTASPTVTAGNKILWKQTGLTPTLSAGIGTFSSTGNFIAQGNVMSLYYGDNFVGETDLTGKNYAFNNLFNGCSKLVEIKDLSLPATTLAQGCYYQMFNGCTSLVTAPVLPSTTLANWCYGSMFFGCTSLTSAPELLATTLADYCYNSMFGSCTSLTTAPELPATTLTNYCYSYMFNGCSRLNYIKAMFTTTPSDTYTNNWVYGVSATGTFVKNDSATWTTTGVNAVPTGWNVYTESEWEYVRQYQLNAELNNKVDKVSSTDNAVVRFDGSTGAIQNSNATVSDNGSVTVYDLVVHGNNDTNNTRMISSSNATNLVFRVENSAKMVINPSRITTGNGQTVDLGSSSIPWNNVYGASFITTGGTSSQFVKGDGSLDSNTYATKSYVDNIVGDIETLLASI